MDGPSEIYAKEQDDNDFGGHVEYVIYLGFCKYACKTKRVFV
jgi:hypothetical protein